MYLKDEALIRNTGQTDHFYLINEQLKQESVLHYFIKSFSLVKN